jgi:hypothetical protein
VAGTDPMRRDVATPDAALCATSSDSGPSAASPISDATALADCADVGASPYGRSPSRSMIVGNCWSAPELIRAPPASPFTLSGSWGRPSFAYKSVFPSPRQLFEREARAVEG